MLDKKSSDSRRKLLKSIAAASGVVCIFSLTAGNAVFAQEDMGTESIGKNEFQKNCASCHGKGGKGDGPLVDFLKQSPRDLTLLSKENGGIYPQVKSL